MFGWFRRSPEEKFARAVFALDRGFPYKSERVETLFSVPFCIARGGGDCDDKADMWYRALRAWNFAPRVTHGEFNGVPHAAVVCRIGSKEFVFCNAMGRVTESVNYFGGVMRNYRFLTEAQYEEWCDKHRIDRA
jgi:hypothetical protein